MTGLVTHHQPPQTSDTIRVDTGIRTGALVVVFYQ
jgi:acetyl/propionyl-CoA carboxylase alpha subunit